MNSYKDFKTAYAHLGLHPGDLGSDEARVIFDAAMSVKQGGTFLEFHPTTGRTTALLGTAVRNVGGKLYVCDDWPKKHSDERRWFDLAITLHHLQQIVFPVQDIEQALNGAGADLILTSRIDPSFFNLPFLGAGCIVISRGNTGVVPDAECLFDNRPIISVWRVNGPSQEKVAEREP